MCIFAAWERKASVIFLVFCRYYGVAKALIFVSGYAVCENWIFGVVGGFRSAPAAGAPATEGGAPQAPPNLTSNRRLQQTQAQVDEVSAPLTAVHL